ncbi:hypothetical protein V2G26_002814 [Clonostachys chloroleuca]
MRMVCMRLEDKCHVNKELGTCASSLSEKRRKKNDEEARCSSIATARDGKTWPVRNRSTQIFPRAASLLPTTSRHKWQWAREAGAWLLLS